MGIFQKNMQLMLGLLKALLPVLYFTGIWSLAITRVGSWTWIFSTRHWGLGQEVDCWFQCWKSLFHFTSLITLVLLMWKWIFMYWGFHSLLSCHFWCGAPTCCLEILDKLQKRICRTVGPSVAASLEPLAHCWNVASLSLFCRYYFGK